MNFTAFLLAAASAASMGTAFAQTKTLYVGQVAPLTGPAASIGVPLTQAAHAYFARVNEGGGIAGHRIVLVDRDDGFKPENTLAEVEKLLGERAPVALINVVGAPNNGDLVTKGVLDANNLVVVGAFTGATTVRTLKNPNMFFVRASVADEARKMVDQVMTLGMTRIGLVHANDAFGKDAKGFVEAALGERKRTLAGAAMYEPATIDVQQAVAALRSADAQAILIFGTGPAAAKFVVEYKKAGGGAMLIANSSTSPEVMAKNAGNELARGVGLVQVVPPLSKVTVPVVREYLDTLRRYGNPEWMPSPYGLEGFIAAKLLAEGIRRSGPNPSRDSIAKALGRIEQLDVGGLTLNYRNGSREGLKSVDIGIMGSNGRLMN
ncbi:MAG: ABC transporter substrate-binding protein [Pseudomonadota bacterium]